MIAVGAPLGLSGTVTSGIVSAVDRTVQIPGENNGSALLVSALQTDAAVNPGNRRRSAGQLRRPARGGADGRRVGAELVGRGVGREHRVRLRVPVAVTRTISNEIIAPGRATHAYFGLQSTPISAGSAAQAGVPQGAVRRGGRGRRLGRDRRPAAR